MRRILLAVMVAALGTTGVALSQSASAAFTCTNGENNPIYSNVNGPVIVPSGVTCNLQSLVVNGSITVQPGGRLHLGSRGMTVKGSVNSDKAGAETSNSYWGNFSILICNTHITGSLNVTRSTDSVYIGDDERCGPDRADGVVNLNNNKKGVTLVGASNDPAAYCAIPSCGLFGGSVNVNGNSGTPSDAESGPSAEITYNHIVSSLNCNGNATIENNNNSVSGARTGQCATDTFWP